MRGVERSLGVESCGVWSLEWSGGGVGSELESGVESAEWCGVETGEWSVEWKVK